MVQRRNQGARGESRYLINGRRAQVKCFAQLFYLSIIIIIITTIIIIIYDFLLCQSKNKVSLLLHSVDDMSLVYWWEILQAILRPTFSPNAISDVTTILSEFSLQIYLLPPFRFKSSNISLPFKMSKLKVWRKAIYNFSMTIFRFLWVKFVTLIDIILISFRM